MKKHLTSIALAIIGFLTTVIQFWPDAMLHMWAILPEELKATLPPVFVKWFTYSLMVITFGAKMVSMQKDRKNLRKQVDDSVDQ